MLNVSLYFSVKYLAPFDFSGCLIQIFNDNFYLPANGRQVFLKWAEVLNINLMKQ